MSDHEHARLMLRMAEKDHTALQGMLDTQIFADEVFDFHAQQTAEKALKAWLSLIGVDYPRIHDLEELLALLAQRGATVPARFYARLLCFGRGEATSSRQDWLLLGKQIAKDILSPLPELEALVRI